MQKTDIEKALAARVREELEPIDTEALFDEMLDECYSLKTVGGPFASMDPASVLSLVDPISYRCGLNDYVDSISRDGDYWTHPETEELYDSADVEKLREEIEAEADEDNDEGKE